MKYLDSKTINAYIQTAYTITDWRLTIRIGGIHPELDQWLRRMHSKSWAYLTAWNPQSVPLSLEENHRRQTGLLTDLAEWPVFCGLGIPDSCDWAPEESVLVVGMPIKQAKSIAQKWDQLAFLYGRVGGKARLVWSQED